MSRIESVFQELKRSGRKALVPYVTAGYPHPSVTLPLMHAMVEAGADVIELGVPFSDPMADGPVIQRAGELALKHGVGLVHVLDMVAQFRKHNAATPIVLMGYANPVEAMGRDAFASAAATAGVDGVIVVDYPPEECAEFASLLRSKSLDLIFLLAPTSTDERVAQVASLASGYIYYVSLKGITGASNLDLTDVAANIKRIRSKTNLPVGVGFGIRDGVTARAICDLADAAIIGTRIIQEIDVAGPGEIPTRIGGFLKGIRAAMDGVTP